MLMLRLGQNPVSFPKPLSSHEEQEYIRLAAEGDPEAKKILVEHNLRLVAHICKKYYAAEAEQDDLISVGTIGLIKGIEAYKPDKGVRLATYAARCIENEILMYFRSQRKTSADISLSEAIDSDSEGEISILDVLCSEDNTLEQLEQSESFAQLRAAIHTELTERERTIINLRYGLEGIQAHTQLDVAKKLNISRSYISRLEKKALAKLRKKLSEDN